MRQSAVVISHWLRCWSASLYGQPSSGSWRGVGGEVEQHPPDLLVAKALQVDGIEAAVLALLPGNPARDTEVIAAWLLRDVDSQTMPLGEGVRVLRVGGDNACHYRDLQDAIDNAPSPTVIRIARNAEYTRQSFKIDDQDITLEGGYPDCSARQPDASTTVIILRMSLDDIVVVN